MRLNIKHNYIINNIYSILIVTDGTYMPSVYTHVPYILFTVNVAMPSAISFHHKHIKQII